MLDESRDTGPKIKSHPGVDYVKAAASAGSYQAGWKPQNKFYTTTTTTNLMN